MCNLRPIQASPAVVCIIAWCVTNVWKSSASFLVALLAEGEDGKVTFRSSRQADIYRNVESFKLLFSNA